MIRIEYALILIHTHWHTHTDTHTQKENVLDSLGVEFLYFIVIIRNL